MRFLSTAGAKNLQRLKPVWGEEGAWFLSWLQAELFQSQLPLSSARTCHSKLSANGSVSPRLDMKPILNVQSGWRQEKGRYGKQQFEGIVPAYYFEGFNIIIHSDQNCDIINLK